MDEVAIWKQLDFDTATDMFVGYVNIRAELDDMDGWFTIGSWSPSAHDRVAVRKLEIAFETFLWMSQCHQIGTFCAI